MSNARDPMQAARGAMRPPLARRFYREVSVGERDGAFAVLLDGKPARTPAKHALATPSRELSEAIAAEWAAQGESIDPMSMPLTRLAHVAIDRVATEGDAVAAEVAQYAGSDLVLYRAAGPDGLVAAQRRHWDPVLAWLDAALGARFVLAEGVRHVAQPEAALAAVRAEVARCARPFALAALASATQLCGSALIALALAAGRLGADAAWAAAHIDEDWNIRRWGEDAEAAGRRAARRAEFDAAVRMLKLL
jgi:chaperone required for assembly of F1-ATPase